MFRLTTLLIALIGFFGLSAVVATADASEPTGGTIELKRMSAYPIRGFGTDNPKSVPNCRVKTIGVATNNEGEGMIDVSGGLYVRATDGRSGEDRLDEVITFAPSQCEQGTRKSKCMKNELDDIGKLLKKSFITLTLDKKDPRKFKIKYQSKKLKFGEGLEAPLKIEVIEGEDGAGRNWVGEADPEKCRSLRVKLDCRG